ncbi:DUF5134 domain-containing protein [Planosporangium thailandense]|uniref:DUF5134 domain-containing protein n=1 Tax=Planosporangium thailandense TaxID=765197 RepID=A0ABX0Y373_9ACTN|nr:DUF5134 domain-containing protein [Planosporangium thailandense]
MIVSLALRWTLTCVFALPGALCLARCVLPAGAGGVVPADRLTGLAHPLMSLAMVAMLWSWGPDRWRAVAVAVFGFGACWFGIRAVVADARWVPVGDRLELAQHALGMGAMVWMALFVHAGMMSPAGSGGRLLAGTGPAAGGAASASGPLSAGDTATVDVWLGTYFLFATLWWMDRAARLLWTVTPTGAEGAVAAGCGGVVPTRRLLASGPAAAAHALMSAGTGVMLVVMS